MKRLVLFAKGNVDVHDSLHSCRIGGEVRWNGINDIVRLAYPGTTVRLRHETATRFDALLAATGDIPEEIAQRHLTLGAYPAAGQFSTAVFTVDADAIVLTIQPDIATGLVRHRRTGTLLYAAESQSWGGGDRDWLRTEFEASPPPDVDATMRNLAAVVSKIQQRRDVPVLVYNVSAAIPGETVACLQGLGETFSTRARRFNLALAEMSERTGLWIVDVDNVIARAGADAHKLDPVHLTPEGNRLVAAEVVRILGEIGLVEADESQCVPA